jgi:hypothetical protein
MKGFYFNEDPYLQALDLDNKIQNFLESFASIFDEHIIDEVFIVKYDCTTINPLYFYCANSEHEDLNGQPNKNAKEIEKKKMKDFDFFVQNIISRQCILNNE